MDTIDKTEESTKPDLFGLLFYKTVRLQSEVLIDPEKFLIELKRKQAEQHPKSAK